MLRTLYACAFAHCSMRVHAQAVTDLAVEYLTNPLLVDNQTPRFSWVLSNNATQQSYRIIISNSETLSPTVWDTGVIAGNATSQIQLAGPQLTSDTDYYWSVTVTVAGAGMQANTLTSTVARFTAGLLSPSDWSAQWIGGYNQLRTTFTLPAGSVTRARAYVTGVGCYELWINGNKVNQDSSGRPTIANPGFSTIYPSRLLYNAYDVSPYLLPGQSNAVGMRLGMCKYGYLGEFCTKGAAGCNAGLLQLNIAQASGNTSITTSPTTWIGTASPLLSDHFYNGEVLDGRMEEQQEGWATGGYVPGEEWKPVVAMSSPTAQLSAHQMPQITGWESSGPRTPVSVTPVQGVPGSWTFDLGLNGAAVCTLTIPGPTNSGVNVTTVYAEQLSLPDHNVIVGFHCPSSCCADGGNCANQTFTYITRGVAAGQNESYTPTFAYSGFRWAQVFGWPSSSPAPTPSALSCTATSTGVPQAGSVNFNPATGQVLNLIQDAIVRSQRSNMHSIPTDCPQREKRGWMADAHVSSTAAALNLFLAPVYENWIRTHADTGDVGCGNLTANWTCPKWHSDQPGKEWDVDGYGPSLAGDALTSPGSPLSDGISRGNCYICCYGRSGFGCQPNTPTNTTGAIADVIPFDKNGYGSFPGSICWTSASFVVSELMLHSYGNVQFLASVYPQLKAHLLFYNGNANAVNASTGLVYWETYGDWNALDSSSKLLLANTYYLYDCLIMSEIALALKDEEDGLAFLGLAALINEEMPGQYFNASKGYWDSGSQAAQSVGLYFGMGGPNITNATGTITAQLVGDVKARGMHLTGGTLGSRFILQALSMSGNGDVALALANQTTVPSWGAMVLGTPTQPALGTLWEGWDGPGGGSSGNHIMFGGGIGEWFYSYALGLRFSYRRSTPSDSSPPPSLPACHPVHLPWDVTATHGVTQADLCVLSTAIQMARTERAKAGLPAGAAMDFHYLRSLVVKAKRGIGIGDGEGSKVRAELQPQAKLVLDHHMLRGLGAAQGHITTPAGRLSASWTHTAPTGLTYVSLALPHAVQGRVYVPRQVLQDGKGSVVSVYRAGETIPAWEGRIQTVPSSLPGLLPELRLHDVSSMDQQRHSGVGMAWARAGEAEDRAGTWMDNGDRQAHLVLALSAGQWDLRVQQE